MTLLEYMDVSFGFCQEKKTGKGEDSWCYSFNERAGVFGVFDGCGGSGARTYSKLKSHTGAFLASRIVSGTVMRWFEQFCAGKITLVGTLEEQIAADLAICTEQVSQEETKLRSKLMRELPTTAAVWVVGLGETGLKAASISAGDSRTYLLDESGLMQISVDDLRGEDAMSDIYNSAPMTNVISAGQPVTLSYAMHTLTQPGILVAATDGCFGYLRSPMEFEYLLLDTLMRSESVSQWNQVLAQEIDLVAGDDQTLAAAAFGYGSFDGMKKSMYTRHQKLGAVIRAFGDDIQCRNEVWQRYKVGYYRLAEGGAPKVE